MRSREEVLISVRPGAFQPTNIVIEPATKIFWKIEGDSKCQSLSDGHTLIDFYNKKDLVIADYVFENEGMYRYYCENYPEEKTGLIIIK